jgi:hypothetical protein
LTGSGTAFTTELAVGDTIYSTGAPTAVCTIASIASATSATCTATPLATMSGAANRAPTTCIAKISGTLRGTATSVGTAVTGTSSAFQRQVSVGDTLTSNSGGTCRVQSISSNTAIVCTQAPSPAFAGTYYNSSRGLVPAYIAEVPVDPKGAGESVCASGSGCTTVAGNDAAAVLSDSNTGYYLQRTNGNRIEVGACAGEQNTSINVKR